MTNQRTIYIFERGILGWQSIFGDWKNWPNQACVWVNKNTPHKSQTLTYFTGPILAGVTRKWRAKQFAKLIQQYQGWRIVLVCHSEGTATALLALKLAGWPLIDELHLICGACDSDFNRNGLNKAILHFRIHLTFVYVAGMDDAMILEDTYIGSICFGLQTAGTPLGLNGPVNEAKVVSGRVKKRIWPSYGHSDCWLPKNFESTMLQITRKTQSAMFSSTMEDLSKC